MSCVSCVPDVSLDYLSLPSVSFVWISPSVSVRVAIGELVANKVRRREVGTGRDSAREVRH